MKKRIMRAGALLLAALLTVGMAAEPAAPCVAASKGIQLKIGKKKVGKKTYTLKKGKKAIIKVTGVKTGGNVRVTFKSKNTKTATVSAKGVVKAKKKGREQAAREFLGQHPRQGKIGRCGGTR